MKHIHVLLDSPARNMSCLLGQFPCGKTFQVQVAVISNFIPPVANAVAWLGAKLGRQGDKELDGCDPPLKGQRICLEDSDRPETWIKYDKIGFLNCDIIEFQWFLKRPGGSGGPQSLGLIHPT